MSTSDLLPRLKPLRGAHWLLSLAIVASAMLLVFAAQCPLDRRRRADLQHVRGQGLRHGAIKHGARHRRRQAGTVCGGGSIGTLKVQTWVDRNHIVLDGWEKRVRGQHRDECPGR